MYLWIIAISLFVLGVAFLVWWYCDYECYDWNIIVSVLCLFCSISMACILIDLQVRVPQDVNNFVRQKAYIENHIADNSIEDAALTAKKIELNDWLYDAQYWLINYPGWSLYPESIINLTPIQ